MLMERRSSTISAAFPALLTLTKGDVPAGLRFKGFGDVPHEGFWVLGGALRARGDAFMRRLLPDPYHSQLQRLLPVTFLTSVTRSINHVFLRLGESPA